MTKTAPSIDMQNVAQQLCRQLGAQFDCSLGSGAYKQAFLIHRGAERRALKIAPILTNRRARFERESAALKECRHTGIANLHYVAAHSIGSNEFWVTEEEFLSGGTLENHISGRKLDVGEVRALGMQLAGAIAHMQVKGYVHRDIKPANILFRRPGEPVLTDFGIVRVLAEPSLTSDFVAQGPGTPLYAAPEQLRNEKAAIDWRTDQFGLALVLAQCLLARPAFAPQNGAPIDAVANVASRASLSNETRRDLQGLGFECLIKALSPWPVQRYRWPGDFIHALAGGS